eukprot:8610496-Lingulodinium_polyedra.AAC.1
MPVARVMETWFGFAPRARCPGAFCARKLYFRSTRVRARLLALLRAAPRAVRLHLRARVGHLTCWNRRGALAKA